ncbi:N-6 DNA methylase [Spirosoma endbachense]|uniref:N-6 DNA methylase n=2 Tax=Spirosoma endbachense TaxID=2666025 RepID=A0A6P1W2H7_9BACT|nr:N-6 DNA methylase [Spirosoma endbachense]
MAQAMSAMAKAINALAYKHGTYNVFADFCEMAAISFSNAVDKQQYQGRESRYMEMIKKYSAEELNEFPKLLILLANEMEIAPRDVLGELFHELELHNQHAGQFFTPYGLCEMMAKMTFDKGIQRTIDEKGHMTLQEPACGSGAMVIAFAMAMYSYKINYQHCLHVSAIDIDIRCVHMTYVQFSLLHIPAVVYAGNTLTMEMRESWYTPAHIMGGWDWRLRSTAKPVPEAAILPIKTETVCIDTTPKESPKTARKVANAGQLTLF